jgi:AcrR family transcriptional regulator
MVDLVPVHDRPLRSHARRNRERIISAAHDALTGTSRDTSLNEIARRAGVGIGTLFRHFPNRDALLEALTAEATSTLCTAAKRLLVSDEPVAALVGWLRELVDHVATYRGLPASLLLAGTGDGECGLAGSYRAIDAAAGALLVRAQRTGQVRHDLDVPALICLVGAVAWLLEQDPESTERIDHVMSVLVDGLLTAPR